MLQVNISSTPLERIFLASGVAFLSYGAAFVLPLVQFSALKETTFLMVRSYEYEYISWWCYKDFTPHQQLKGLTFLCLTRVFAWYA